MKGREWERKEGREEGKWILEEGKWVLEEGKRGPGVGKGHQVEHCQYP